MPDWKARVRARPAGALLDEDTVEEIAQHADELYRSAIAAGRSEPDAEAAVESEMDNLASLARAARRARRVRPRLAPDPVAPGRTRAFAAFVRDVMYGTRLLLARPAFSTIAVLTLALGIGANTAIFSVVNSVLLSPLPFPDPDRLVMVWEQDAADPTDLYIVSAPNYQDWVTDSTAFERMAIWEYQSFNIAGAGSEPEQIPGMRASSSLFPMLGIAPQLGRTFTEAEEAPGHVVAVISDGVWRRHFGARPDVIGHPVRLNGKPFEVIGVMPATFQFTHRRFAIWTPIAFNEQDRNRTSHSFYAAARLKQGVSFDAAKAEIEALGARMEAQHEGNRGERASITRMDELGIGQLRTTLLTLLGAVGLVLLIACVNVANLQLAQASGRHREFAIRAALGAGRGRLGSQLLAEGLVLAVAGAGAGLLLAWVGTTAMAKWLPPSIRFAPFRETATVPIDPAVLAFTCGIALLTAVVFSLAPIVGAWRVAPGASLKTGGDRGGTARFTVLRATLVASELALALMVLAGAGLMIKSVARLVAVDPGLNPANVLIMDIALPQADFYGPPERTMFCADVEREVSALPGVVRAAAISHLPLSGANAGRGITIEGRPAPAPNEGASAAYRLTCPGYFAALGIPILKGRDFTHADATTAPPVAIVNETTAERYWPGQDPVGQRFKLGGFASTNPWLTVVGVARDVRHFGLDSDARREIFRPYSQAAWPVMTMTVKTAASPMTAAPAVRSALSRIDPDQPVSRVRTMDQVVQDSIGSRTFPMLLLGMFAAVALVLAAVGVYGVVSYIVAQRTREIGIRMALGARAAQVVRLVVTRALVPIGVGIVVGVTGSLAASRLLAALLYEVRPGDVTVLGMMVVLLGGAAIAASLLPAHRAAAVDPLVVLKED